MGASHMWMVEPFEVAYPFPFALLSCLHWAWYLGFYRLIVEGEDKLLFQEVASASPSLTDFGTIVEDIRDFCNYFYHISFKANVNQYPKGINLRTIFRNILLREW